MPGTGDASALRTVLLTALAMCAFAANSLLCREALRKELIDPALFAVIRVTSGALALAVIMRIRSQAWSRAGDWKSALALFVYLANFTFAYMILPAGTGALILFGAVQLTMITAGLLAGERFASLAWCGIALAAAGLIYLMLPSVAAPSLTGALPMAVAGIAWGMYSLRGRGVADPLATTAGNFALAVPFTLTLAVLFMPDVAPEPKGVLLAVVSGAITSGLGYAIWYAALARLSSLRAAAVQLSVPLIAAFAGVALLAEPFTARLGVATITILGGIALVLVAKVRKAL